MVIFIIVVAGQIRLGVALAGSRMIVSKDWPTHNLGADDVIICPWAEPDDIYVAIFVKIMDTAHQQVAQKADWE